MTNEKFVMSFSGGKDSILALYRMIKKGFKPVALITTIKKAENKSWTHGLSEELLNKVSISIGIPLLKVECDVNEYEEQFEKALEYSKSMGASICAFGDIDIEVHRKWDTDRCVNSGLKAEFPLWKEDREKLVYEFIDSGFKTVINKVNLQHMGEEFLGEILTKEVIENIKDTGSDVCGENGEYHTFVIDGPLFKNPIHFDKKEIVLENGYGYLNIK